MRAELGNRARRLFIPPRHFVPLAIALVLAAAGCSGSSTPVVDQAPAEQSGSDVAAPAAPVAGEARSAEPDKPPQPVATFKLGERPKQLSEFALFLGDGSTQQPADGVVPYDLITPLFSDYTSKYRFVKLPAGQSAEYRQTGVFEFPVGMVIAKTFASPRDMRDPSQGERLLETRVLVHQPDGWAAYPYLWNEEQNEAALKLAGTTMDVSWVHHDGTERTNNYIIPNANQCAGCHHAEGKFHKPIGPQARHMNHDFVYADGTSENQLLRWTRIGILSGAPDDPAEAERLAQWDDPESGTLDERARAWLEINCAHCHNPQVPARTSGLHLAHDVELPSEYGVYKTPVAAGRGSGGLSFGIVPGEPEKSILYFRIASDHPGIMMPELGKRLIHEEGVELIRQWIAEMEDTQRLSALSR